MACSPFGRALHAAVTVEARAQRALHDRHDLPAVAAAVLHVLVDVVHVAVREQDEAVTGVAEARLHAPPRGRGDRVGSDRRVAVMRDARDRAGFALRGARELGEERRRALPGVRSNCLMPSYSLGSMRSAAPACSAPGASAGPGSDAGAGSAAALLDATTPAPLWVLASAKLGSDSGPSLNMRAIGTPSPASHGCRRCVPGTAYVSAASSNDRACDRREAPQAIAGRSVRRARTDARRSCLRCAGKCSHGRLRTGSRYKVQHLRTRPASTRRTRPPAPRPAPGPAARRSAATRDRTSRAA